jgi:hypothetical protein
VVAKLGYGFGWQIALTGDDTLLMHGGGFPGIRNAHVIHSHGGALALR